MDLVCPSCQRRLTIDNRYAGMVVKCPLCNSNLQAPVLLSAPPIVPLPAASPPVPPTPPSAIPPLAPPPAVPPVAPASLSLEAATPMPAAEVITPAASPSAPPPAPPPLDVPEVIPETAPLSIARQTDYRRSFRLHLRPDIVEWIAPICVVAVFVLSLFAWYYREDYALNLWELAFNERGYAIYTFYTVVFVFLAIPITVIAFCLEKRWIPFPEGLRPFWRWRSLIVGGLVGLPFLLFLGDYVQFQFLPFGTQASIAMKLAFRIHLLAFIGCGLQFWLELRNASNLPLPKLTVRW